MKIVEANRMYEKTKNLLIATALAALGLMATACKPTATDNGIRYVAVKDGLNMREEPSPTGRKMLTIPYRQEVQKLEEKPESFTIDKTEGKWTKVTWQGKTGWVFGGFLSATPPGAGSTQSATTASGSAGCEAECTERERIEKEFCENDSMMDSRNNVNPNKSEAKFDACRTKAMSKAESCKRNCS